MTFSLSDLIQVLEDTMTHEEIEIFLSNINEMLINNKDIKFCGFIYWV